MAIFHVAGKRIVSEDTGYMFKVRCSWFSQWQTVKKYGQKNTAASHN